MQTGIIYLLTKRKHAARLVVSIASLRRWYAGPITIFTTRPESHEIGELCCQDRRLRTTQVRISERKANSQVSAFLTKSTAIANSPYPATVYLDADTLVVGDISPLLDSAALSDVTAIVFHRWKTTDPHLVELLTSWRQFEGKKRDRFGLKHLIDGLLANPFPGINAGILAMKPTAPILSEWRDLGHLGRKNFIPDEIALQLLLQRHPHRLLDTRFNCHPSVHPEMRDVRIWHYAGSLHLCDWGPERNLWYPTYLECRRRNLAKMATWSNIDRFPIPMKKKPQRTNVPEAENRPGVSSALSLQRQRRTT